MSYCCHGHKTTKAFTEMLETRKCSAFNFTSAQNRQILQNHFLFPGSEDHAHSQEGPVRSKKQKRVPELAGATAQPATQQAKQGAEGQPQRQLRVARHAGRFQKREKGKHVLGYSSTDLAAILGAGPSTDSLSNYPEQVSHITL